MADWKDWSDGWLREGYFISYTLDNARYYEHVIARDIAHYEYEWHETIPAGKMSGPRVPDYLVPTVGYDKDTNQNQIWQMIFGIKGQVYIYIELPTDIHRHGLPKVPKPTTELPYVSHFEEWMSPYQEPSFITEHFMMKPGFDRIAFSAYNPGEIDIKPWLNIFINKMITERIGTEQNDILTPTSIKWKETLDKLSKRVIPHRPITLMPVRAPAAEV
jgi:hypothetical protein